MRLRKEFETRKASNETHVLAIGCRYNHLHEAVRNVDFGFGFRPVALRGFGDDVEIIAVRIGLLAIEILSVRPFAPIVLQRRLKFLQTLVGQNKPELVFHMRCLQSVNFNDSSGARAQ